MSWSTRLADLSQRTLSVLLLGLTVYGGVMLANGGYSVMQRRKGKKPVENIVESVRMSSDGQPKVRECDFKSVLPITSELILQEADQKENNLSNVKPVKDQTSDSSSR